MKLFLGVLSIVVGMGLGFLYQTKQLEVLKSIPEFSQYLISGLTGSEDKFQDLQHPKDKIPSKSKLSLLDPRQMLASVEKSMEKIKERQQAFRDLEGPSGETFPSADKSGQNLAKASAPVETKERPTSLHRYGMNLKKLTANEINPFLGKWVFKDPRVPAAEVRLHLQPEKLISSATLKWPALKSTPAINMAVGENTPLLWQDTQTGQLIVVLKEHQYLQITNIGDSLNGSLYSGGFSKAGYQKILEFPLIKDNLSQK